MAKELHTILSIAASDPMGGAGIQSDIRCGNSLGVHVLTAITGVTVQNSRSFSSMGSVPSELLKHQLEAIIQDVMPDTVKIGMTGNLKNMIVINEFLIKYGRNFQVIIDPIIKATVVSDQVIDNYEIEEMKNYYLDFLFPKATVITPNYSELSLFSGKNLEDISDVRKFRELLNCKSVIIKGGHSQNKTIEDILINESIILKYSHLKFKCENLHGTGCAYSSILASFMALGESLENAFKLTSSKMTDIISKSMDYKLGKSLYGPLNINSYSY